MAGRGVAQQLTVGCGKVIPMEDLKRDVREIKECITDMKVLIGQHDVRVTALEEHKKEQNGLLGDLSHGQNKMFTKLDELGVGLKSRINEVERATLEREAGREIIRVERDAATAAQLHDEMHELGACSDEKLQAVRNGAKAEFADIRLEWLTNRSKEDKKFLWKLVGAASTVGFVCFLIAMSYLFHIFAFWP